MTTPVTSLLLGDCRDLLPISADVCITDPPYAVDRNGEMLGQIAANYHDKGMHTRGFADHSPEQFEKLMVPAWAGVYDSLPKGGTLISFTGNRTLHETLGHAAKAGFQVIDLIVMRGGGSFAKSTTTLSPKHEIIAYMRKPGGVRHINPDRRITNVWEIPKTKNQADHPTTKPQAWMERIVEVFSEPGDKILDPFCGSGSTLVAAKRLGRDSVGIEVDPEYVGIAWGRLTKV